jgi:hypothetical protein
MGKRLTEITEETRRKVLDARRRALPFDRIAETLKISPEVARRAFEEALDAETLDLTQDQARRLDLSRLDRMTAGLYPDAIAGSVRHAESLLRLMDARNRLLSGPVVQDVTVAYDASVDGLALTPADGALVAAGRRLAQQIDAASGSFDPLAETKAMYLMPHLMTVLRELGATPAARASVKTAKEEQGGKLAQLRALRDAESKPTGTG